MTGPPQPFWQAKTLAQMTKAEWESLCDGCGLCCVIKLQDEDTEQIYYTDVSCRLLDTGTCRCRDYPRRKRLVPDCVQLSPNNAGRLGWMPESCAYRRLAEGRGLADWHPLVSGDPDSVHRAGISVRGRVTPETEFAVEDLPDRIVDWR